MKRKNLFNALLIAGLLASAPMVADAAGLGTLKVNSALGQPLRAEIDLISVPKDEVDLITARVASAEAYKQAKVERQEGLGALRFTVEKRANGEPYLKISSIQAFNEPFVDLLIQLDWPSGRLLREYTILLDPPGFTDTPAVSAPKVVADVTKPSASAASRSLDVTPAQKPAFATPAKKSSTKKSTQATTKTPPPPSASLAEQTFPRQGGDAALAEASPARAPKPAAGASTETYKVKKGDSLYKIARDLKPEGYSLDQVMVALYEGNKNAFDGNNMNRMKTGQILRVPDNGALDATGQREASKEIKAHAADWNAYRQKLAGTVSEQAPAKSEASSESSGKITAKAEDKAAKSSESSKDVLKLSRSESISKGAGTQGKGSAADAKAMQDKLIAAQDDALAKEKALKEANSRISDLDKNIKEMQALLELKNKQLADLEKQAKTKAAPAPVPVPAPLAKTEVTPKPAPKTEAPKPEVAKPAVLPPPAAPAPTTTPAPTPTPVPEKPAEPLVKAVPDQAKPAPMPVPVPSEKKPAIKPVAKPVTPPEPEMSLLDTIMSNPLYLAGVAAVIVAALFAGLWALGRRRRKSLASFEDSIMTGGGDIKTNTVFGNTAGGQIDTGDTSFLTDFSQAGMGAIDTNDVDPIAEAEVYMAYGRDAQAEEILKEAMSKDPTRHEIQLKLLEIYAGRKNAAAFETLAAELYAATSGRGPVWEKAAEFGRGLDPANPLYAAPENRVEDPVAAHSAMLAGLAAAPLAHELDAHLDLDKPDSVAAETSALDETTVRLDEDSALEGAMDLDLDTIMGQAPADATAANDAQDAHSNLDALDFNLDTIIPQAVEKHAEVPPTAPVMETHALDLHIPEPEPEVTRTVDTNKADEPMALDFDFNLEPEPNEPAAGQPKTPAVEEPLMPELDLSGIDLNLDRPAPSADHLGGTSLEEATTLVGDNTVWEEASTKLDLARAYLEMGDQEGAREILQEVVTEGGPEQQAEAKKLLGTLS